MSSSTVASRLALLVKNGYLSNQYQYHLEIFLALFALTDLSSPTK
jgi:hypothetical protein